MHYKKYFVSVKMFTKPKSAKFNEIFGVSSPLKNKKLNNKHELVEKNKYMNPDFQQNHFSRTAESI